MTPLRSNFQCFARSALVLSTLRWVAVWVTLPSCIWWNIASESAAYTRESPEVRAMVDKGKAYLEKRSRETRLGGRCLIGLVYIKEDQPKHRFVKEALLECQRVAYDKDVGDATVYGYGLALIFLTELDAEKHKDLIKYYLNLIQQRQQGQGSWGYVGETFGDTSQTQYGCLGYWEAFQKGFSVDPNRVAKSADWLMGTQDESGGWHYKATVVGGEIKTQEEITCSRVSAAMGSLLICADLFGILQPDVKDDAQGQANPVSSLVKVESAHNQARRRLSSSALNRTRLLETVKRGNAWMDANYETDIGRYNSYYYYALERYKTLQAILEGSDDPEPEWYNKGVEHCMKAQNALGYWDSGTGPDCDTAFTILFLIRSMSISYGSLGEGLAIGGEFNFSDISKIQVQGGKLVSKYEDTDVGQMLGSLDEAKLGDLDKIINGSSRLVLGDIDEKSIRRLRQLVRSDEPAARIVAVKALAQTGDFDHVPTLLYALGQNDPRLVLEARDGLRFISRRFEGFGLEPEPTPELKFDVGKKFEARDRWVKWYQSVRPDAPLVLE